MILFLYNVLQKRVTHLHAGQVSTYWVNFAGHTVYTKSSHSHMLLCPGTIPRIQVKHFPSTSHISACKNRLNLKKYIVFTRCSPVSIHPYLWGRTSEVLDARFLYPFFCLCIVQCTAHWLTVKIMEPKHRHLEWRCRSDPIVCLWSTQEESSEEWKRKNENKVAGDTHQGKYEINGSIAYKSL